MAAPFGFEVDVLVPLDAPGGKNSSPAPRPVAPTPCGPCARDRRKAPTARAAHVRTSIRTREATDRQMSDVFLETPVLERLWAALDILLEAAEVTADGSDLELSLDTGIREVARAIVAAKEAARLERRGADRAVGAAAGAPPDDHAGSAGTSFSRRRS